MLAALLESLRKAAAADYAADQVGQVVEALAEQELGRAALMAVLGFAHRPSFRAHYLDPALSGGWIERTQPEAPRSPSQRYRLTEKGVFGCGATGRTVETTGGEHHGNH